MKWNNNKNKLKTSKETILSAFAIGATQHRIIKHNHISDFMPTHLLFVVVSGPQANISVIVK